jgi:hypothetical protein
MSDSIQAPSAKTSRLKLIWRILFPKITQQKQAAAESAAVRGLKSQIRILEGIIDNQQSHIKTLLAQRKGNIQEQLMGAGLNVLSSIFTGKEQKTIHEFESPIQTGTTLDQAQPKRLESGVELSEAQIDSYLSMIPEDKRAALKEQGFNDFRKIVKLAAPEISDTSIMRAHQKLKDEN